MDYIDIQIFKYLFYIALGGIVGGVVVGSYFDLPALEEGLFEVGVSSSLAIIFLGCFQIARILGEKDG